MMMGSGKLGAYPPPRPSPSRGEGEENDSPQPSHSLRGYVVDFFCPSAKLIVELDGGQHDDRAAHERRRTDYLTRAGFRVLRFWNNELNENEQAVPTIIGQALGIDETHHAQTH